MSRTLIRVLTTHICGSILKKICQPPEVSLKEMQSLAQAQEMVISVFSSIAYIRDLFSEDAYEDAKVAGMQTKRLKRDCGQQVSRFLDWIEKGCFDALQKKYLKSIIFGIFIDPASPTVMLETYTLTIDYPSSAVHQEFRDLSDQQVSMKLTVDKEGSRKESILGSNAFQKEIVAVIRNLCVLTQTLGPLPEKRYLTMQLTYYDELTPRDYEPPGFTPQDFDINYIFESPTMKHQFGKANSGHHNLQLSMETACREPEEVKETCDAVVPATLKLDGLPDLPAIAEESQPQLIKSVQAVTLQDDSETKVNHKLVAETQVVRCACEDRETDLDMIQCDFCGNWQHTPCSGYCSNRDKRIPKDNYKCYHCRFGHSKKAMVYLKDLACFRRVVAVLFTDGFKSISELSLRLSTYNHHDTSDTSMPLGCTFKKASSLVIRLEEEGLLERKSIKGKYSFSPKSGQAVKEKLNHYFGPDPQAFPDFPDPSANNAATNKRAAPTGEIPAASSSHGFQVKPVPSLLKRRKSEVSLKIDA